MPIYPSTRRHHLGEAPLTPATAAPAPQYYEEPGAYVLTAVLSGNQESIENGVFMDGDSDFKLLAITGSSTGTYQFRMKTPGGRYWPQNYARNGNIIGSGTFAMPLGAPLVFASGAKLAVDLKDLSGSSNTIEIVFLGIKLFRLKA